MANVSATERKKKDLKVGQRVSFLRSANKAVKLHGEIASISEDEPIVTIKGTAGDGSDYFEGAHVDDVTTLEDEQQQQAASSGNVLGKPAAAGKPLMLGRK